MEVVEGVAEDSMTVTHVGGEGEEEVGIVMIETEAPSTGGLLAIPEDRRLETGGHQ